VNAREATRAIGIVALCAAAIALVRGALFRANARVKETSDVYVLPPPDEVVVLSLGYRSALADVLWSHVLVSQGLHTMEKRRFDNLTRLLDSINALDPTFRDPYIMADALITFQANTTPVEEVRKAREIMERGVKNRPLDAELWVVLGQFVAFVAPGTYLEDPAEQKQWMLDGAGFLARAAELGGEDANISWQAIGGAGILNRAGQRDATVSFLRRTLAVTDDPELRERLERQLNALVGEAMMERHLRREEVFRRLWKRDLPFVRKTSILLLGPPRDPAYCAGPAHADEPGCAPTWREWAERQERE
jgi:hypothetical protein